MAKLKKTKEKKEVKRFVVQIREMLDNKKYSGSVTKIIGPKDAKDIYKMLEDK